MRRIAAADAVAAGIDPGVFDRQITQESGYNVRAGSSAGAEGIAQFMPGTARGYGIDPWDPVAALKAAAKMDAQNLSKYGSYARMLSAYNSGKPDAYLDKGFADGQTYDYVRSILNGRTPAVGQTPNGKLSAANQQPALAGGSGSGIDFKKAFAQYLLQSSANTASGGMPDFSGLTQLAQLRNQQAPQLKVAVDHSDPVSPNAGGVVQLAKQYLGTKYAWGGTTPRGFDCSGFVQFLAAKKGVKVPRTTYEQWNVGTPVAQKQLAPGDTVFFEPTAKGPGHEGLYIGHGQFIHAPHTGDVVKISKLSDYQSMYVGARRVV